MESHLDVRLYFLEDSYITILIANKTKKPALVKTISEYFKSDFELIGVAFESFISYKIWFNQYQSGKWFVVHTRPPEDGGN